MPVNTICTRFGLAVAFSILLLAPHGLIAQSPDTYFSSLGSTCYKEKISRLENYVVPKKYAEKSSQAWYDEILKDQNKSLLYSFKEDRLVNDTLLLNKCYGILARISAGNPNFSFDTIKFYIKRSVVANAACYGEGTIMVNLGLFLWVDNDDELALVLAHEMAHQLLNHIESKIEKSIATLTSDDFKEELKNIKKADYGKFERYRNLMKGLNMESGKHSRYKESEADSLGVVLARNAGYNIPNGSKILLKLDKVDGLFTSDKLYVLKDFFEKAPIDLTYFKVKPKYNGLSGVNVTMNADKDFDSIKTHPDCIKRYEAIAGKNEPVNLNCCTALNSQYDMYKKRAMLEMVRYLYENNALGLCVHLSLFALKNNYNPGFYNCILSLCFSKLYANDKKLERFNSANSDAARGSNLKQLQDFLFDVSTPDLDALSAWFLNSTTAISAEDHEFAGLMYNIQVKMKDSETAWSDYNRKFPKNKYQYLNEKKSK
jgi:hypothetical protein